MLVKSPIASKMFETDVKQLRVPNKVKNMLFGTKDAVVASIGSLEGGDLNRVRNMDVWAGRFDLVEDSQDNSEKFPACSCL